MSVITTYKIKRQGWARKNILITHLTNKKKAMIEKCTHSRKAVIRKKFKKKKEKIFNTMSSIINANERSKFLAFKFAKI
jgi:hypothetical protein